MSKFIQKIPGLSLILILFLSVVVAVLFALGGSQDIEIAGNPWSQPNFTDTLLNWTYFLFFMTVALTLIVSIVNFVKNFKANPKKGLTSLSVIVVFVAVFVVSWVLGSSDTLNIIGYEGSDNTGFWAQYSDMCLYAAYTLACSTIVALFGSMLYAKLK